MASITYENKVALNVDPTIPDKNKCTAGDMNEIKSVVNGKQDELVSGTNIKTINDVSLLGSGNITISGGSTPTISYSTSSETDVGTTQSLALDLDTLNVGRYIFYNKVSKDWFYFKYTKPGASTKTNSSFKVTNGTEYLIGASSVNYRAIEIEMYNKTSDLGNMSLAANEALCKVTLKSAKPGYTSRQTYPANSQEISYYFYLSSAIGDLTVGAAFDSTDSYLIDNKLTSKQDTLVSGTNIKTINNNSLLGSGNISLEATPEISIGTTTPSGDEVLWINPEDTPSGSLNPITNEYSEATDKGYSCDYLNGKILWTNSSPNSVFAPQDITLNSSNYNYLEIYFKSFTDQNIIKSIKVEKGQNALLDCSFFFQNSTYIGTRIVEYTNDTTLYANSGRRIIQNAQIVNSEDNGWIIPTKIIGYK